jgi:hypothetical protein
VWITITFGPLTWTFHGLSAGKIEQPDSMVPGPATPPGTPPTAPLDVLVAVLELELEEAVAPPGPDDGPVAPPAPDDGPVVLLVELPLDDAWLPPVDDELEPPQPSAAASVAVTARRNAIERRMRKYLRMPG